MRVKISARWYGTENTKISAIKAIREATRDPLTNTCMSLIDAKRFVEYSLNTSQTTTVERSEISSLRTYFNVKVVEDPISTKTVDLIVECINDRRFELAIGLIRAIRDEKDHDE